MKTNTKTLIALIVCTFSAYLANAQSLPHYEITINQIYLDSMNAHALDETYFPAVFKVDGIEYSVQARYKGSTTLLFPKKSWAIKFDNTNNPFNVERINLHADYGDYSAMRNFLIFKLFNHLGIPASQIEHVTYTVNGNNWGVYTKTEQIDNYFLARNGRACQSLYKANNHAANLAPHVTDRYYSRIWDIEGCGDISYNELRVLTNKILYMSKDEFDNQIGSLIDTDNALSFFAVLFTFTEMDNFTKNIWINKNSNTQKFEFIPWDNEGSFGNSAVGDFDSTMVSYNMDDDLTAEHQLLLQRLLENSNYKTIFQNKVNDIINNGFAYIDSVMDTTYTRIKADVYNDPNKRETNAQFDEEQNRLKWFLTQRKAFLQGNSLPNRVPYTDLTTNNALPTTDNPMMTIRIKAPKQESVRVYFADSLNFNTFGTPFKLKSMSLYDDGLHGDLLANDLIYGNIIDTRTFVSNLVPFTISAGYITYPANSLFYIDYYRSKTYAINKANTINNIADSLSFEKVYAYGTKQFVKFVNHSSQAIDLSYCHLRNGVNYNDFMFPQESVIKANDSLIVAANPEMSDVFFTNIDRDYNLYYNINTGDSLYLLSPLLTPLTQTKVEQISTLSATALNVIFNEINYSSISTHNTKDWVEIYNAGNNTADLSGWIFRDNDNGHKFELKSGLTLAPGAYLVIAEDTTALKSFNPTLKNVVGNIDFGLSSSGEQVRLFDNIGNIVDSVEFNSVAPWPTAAKGTGATLELIAPTLDNAIASNWFAKTGSFGTPGLQNNVPTDIKENSANIKNMFYPNPTNGIVYMNTKAGATIVELLNPQGLLLDKASIEGNSTGTEVFNLSGMPSGIYLIKANENGTIRTLKIILQK